MNVQKATVLLKKWHRVAKTTHNFNISLSVNRKCWYTKYTNFGKNSPSLENVLYGKKKKKEYLSSILFLVSWFACTYIQSSIE